MTYTLIIRGTKPRKEKVNSLGIRLMLSDDRKRSALSSWKHLKSRTLSSMPYVLTLANEESLHPTLPVGVAIGAKDWNLSRVSHSRSGFVTG